MSQSTGVSVNAFSKEQVETASDTFKYYGSHDIMKYLWTVEVKGKLFPARQLMLHVRGLVPNASLNSYQAVAELQRLGFKTFYKGQAQ